MGFITRIFATEIAGIPLNYVIVAIVVGVMIARHVTKRKKADNMPAGGHGGLDGTTKDDAYQGPALDDMPKDTEYVKEDGGLTGKDGNR